MYDEDMGESAFDEGYHFALQELSEYPVFSYMARSGDAIQARLEKTLDESRRLRQAGFAGAALAVGITGVEIVIRYFLLRALVQGAFASDELYSILGDRILPQRPADRDRQLLPGLLRPWKIEIAEVVADRKQVWAEVQRLVEVRNRYLHQADDVSDGDAAAAVWAAEQLMLQVVLRLAKRVGPTPQETGRWSTVKRHDDESDDPELRRMTAEMNPPRKFDVEDPFEK